MTAPLGAPQTLATSQAEAVRIGSFLQKVYGWMCIGLADYRGRCLRRGQLPRHRPDPRWRIGCSSGWSCSPRSDSSGTSARRWTVCRRRRPPPCFRCTPGSTESPLPLCSWRTPARRSPAPSSRPPRCSERWRSTDRSPSASLAGVGQFAFMGLIGVVIASIVGIFWQNDMFQFMLSVCGVVVFTGAHRLGRPEAQGDGAGLAGWPGSAPTRSSERCPCTSISSTCSCSCCGFSGGDGSNTWGRNYGSAPTVSPFSRLVFAAHN